jgi:hypothetical protein
MKVSQMKKGHLYKIPWNCKINIENFCSGHYGIDEETGELNSPVSVMRIHKQTDQGFRFLTEYRCRVLLYLGSYVDNWKLYGIKKHHYFLYDKKSIIIDNYCMKTLEEVIDGEI